MRTGDVGYWRGLSYPFRGARFVFVSHPGLARFWLPPIILTLLALLAAAIWAVGIRKRALALLWSVPEAHDWLGRMLGWLHGAAEILVGLLAFLVGAVLVLLVANVAAAPFHDALSEEVERIRTGRGAQGFSVRALVGDLARTVALEATKLSAYLAIMLPLLLVSWLVPGIGSLVYSLAAFLFTAYYFALDYMDWAASRHGLSVRERIGLVRQHAAAALGFGTGVWVILFVPILNLLFMPAAVAGGTLLFLELSGSQRHGNHRTATQSRGP